jgi:primosomal protein N' (replication factor Y)
MSLSNVRTSIRLTPQKQPVLKVAVSVPLSRAFDYLPPAGGPVPSPGCRVRVPFGPRRQVGLVLGHSTESGLAPGKIRRCTAVLDEEPLLREADLRLLRFTSDYYHHPVGEVVAAALPAMLRQGRSLHPVVETIVATELAGSTDVETLARRAPRQAELLETVTDAGGNGIEADQLTELLPQWRRAAHALFGKGLIERIEMRAPDFDEAVAPEARPGPTLNPWSRA